MPQSTLTDIQNAADCQISFSASGAGGALIFKSDQLSTGGAVLKFEGRGSVEQGEKVSTFASEFLSRAQGERPFQVPGVTAHTAASGEIEAFTTYLNNNRDLVTVPAGREKQFGKALQNLGAFDGGGAICQMELASGTQMNKLGADTKLNLFRSPEFAAQMGRAAPVTYACGYNDQAAIGSMETRKGGSNVSNFMYDPEQGALTVIDPSTSGARRADFSDRYTRYGTDTAPGLRDAGDQLNHLVANRENFECYLENACDGAANGKDNSAFYEPLNSFLSDNFGDNLFSRADSEGNENKADVEAFTQITDLEKKQFTLNYLSGAIDGLDYLKNNLDALEQAAETVADTVEIDGQTHTVSHFYNQGEMTALRETLGQIDTVELRQNFDARVGEYCNALDQRAAQAESEAARLDQKIDKRENNLLGRIQNFFDRGRKLDQMKNDKAEAEAQAGDLRNQAGKLREDRDTLGQARAGRAEREQQALALGQGQSPAQNQGDLRQSAGVLGQPVAAPANAAENSPRRNSNGAALHRSADAGPAQASRKNSVGAAMEKGKVSQAKEQLKKAGMKM